MPPRRDGIDQLLNRLNTSGLQNRDTPLYEVIALLINKLKRLESLVGGSSGDINNITNLTEITQVLSLGIGDDGGSGLPGPPGNKGDKGDTGSGGAAGPVTVGPMGLNGEDGLQGFPIPGNQGIQGIQGIQGPAGPVTLGPMGLNGEDGLMGFPVPGPIGPAGISNAGWTLVAAQAVAGAADYVFDDLNYSELFIFAVGVTKSASGILIIEVSDDNGVTYYTSSGDYSSFAAAGTLTNQSNIAMHSTNATTARYGRVLITGCNLAMSKHAMSSSALTDYLIPITTTINAIKVRGSGGGTLNAGTIYVLGR